MAKYTAEEKREALTALRRYIKPGSTLYTVLRSVSRSGMTRHIKLYAMHKGKPVYLSGYAAIACGFRLDDNGGVIIGGCGMDMGFSLAYTVASACYPKSRPFHRDEYAKRIRHEWL